MRRPDLRRAAGVGALMIGVACSVTAVASSAHADEVVEDPSGESTVQVVDDAVFNWSVSDQSNAESHNPGADNFLAAGTADPGRGGVLLSERRWSARSGNVTVQKKSVSGTWETATWKGLGTNAKGEGIGLYGPFSDHRVNITDGTGTLDADADDANLAWTGTFTVVYYGGNTVFTVTDPAVVITGGKGRIVGTLGGWIADRNDSRIWTPAEPKRLTVATLSDVDVTDSGIVVTPDYRGEKVEGSIKQLRTGADWGSFPQEFVSYLGPLNTDQFWYSTGLQSDWTKLPSPLVVGWGGEIPEQPSTPAPSGSVRPTAKPSNPVVTRPPSSSPTRAATPTAPTESEPPVVPGPGVTTPGRTDLPTASDATAPPTQVLPSSSPAAGVAPMGEPTVRVAGGVSPRETVQAVGTLDGAAPVASSADAASGWWIGGGFFLAAAAVLLAPVPRRRPS